MVAIDTGPPQNSSGRLGLIPDRTRGKTKNDRIQIANRAGSINRYCSLLWRRWKAGPLKPFPCSRCGGMSLDPCGWDRKSRRWGCESCLIGGML
jgi:hypothetical protein